MSSIEWAIGEHAGIITADIAADICAAAKADRIPMQIIDDTIVIDPANKHIEFKFASASEASAMMEHASAAAADDVNDLTAFIVRLIG